MWFSKVWKYSMICPWIAGVALHSHEMGRMHLGLAYNLGLSSQEWRHFFGFVDLAYGTRVHLRVSSLEKSQAFTTWNSIYKTIPSLGTENGVLNSGFVSFKTLENNKIKYPLRVGFSTVLQWLTKIRWNSVLKPCTRTGPNFSKNAFFKN